MFPKDPTDEHLSPQITSENMLCVNYTHVLRTKYTKIIEFWKVEICVNSSVYYNLNESIHKDTQMFNI